MSNQHQHRAAAHRRAIEQLRSNPGSWQPIKTETTYGSDTFIPELSEHYAPVEPEQQDKLNRLIEFDMETAKGLVRDIGNRPMTVEGSFDYCGQSYSYKAEAKPTDQLHSYTVGPAESVEALEAIDLHPLVAAVRAQSKTVAHLGNRVESLEELHAAVVDLNQRFNLDPLVARIELLEATQHAHIEALAMAERVVRVSDHAKHGWRDKLFAKPEITYGSNITVPELSEHYAPVEPEQQDKLYRLIEFDMEELSKSDVKAAELEWARTARGMRSDELRPAAAADTRRALAMQDRIRDGSLTLADALKEINGEPEPAQPFIAKYILTAGNIQQDSFRYDQSDSNSVLFDLAKLELGSGFLGPGDNIKIAHRWGEMPTIGVYSTIINYRVESVSSGLNDRPWTIRAVRVDASDSEPKPAADAQPLTLLKQVAIGMAHFASMARLGDDATPAAGDLLRVIAAWLRRGDASARITGGMVANLLDNEASR